MTTNPKKQPTHRICFQDGSIHREIGAGWKHGKGEGLYIELHALPVDMPADSKLRLVAFERATPDAD